MRRATVWTAALFLRFIFGRRTMTSPTPEQCARHILRLLVGHFHAQPGRILSDASMLRVFSSDGWDGAGYPPGRLYAVDLGWLTPTDDKLTLTTAGYAAAFDRAPIQ